MCSRTEPRNGGPVQGEPQPVFLCRRACFRGLVPGNLSKNLRHVRVVEYTGNRICRIRFAERGLRKAFDIFRPYARQSRGESEPFVERAQLGNEAVGRGGESCAFGKPFKRPPPLSPRFRFRPSSALRKEELSFEGLLKCPPCAQAAFPAWTTPQIPPLRSLLQTLLRSR